MFIKHGFRNICFYHTRLKMTSHASFDLINAAFEKKWPSIQIRGFNVFGFYVCCFNDFILTQLNLARRFIGFRNVLFKPF